MRVLRGLKTILRDHLSNFLNLRLKSILILRKHLYTLLQATQDLQVRIKEF
jgi:hypothetical protein